MVKAVCPRCLKEHSEPMEACPDPVYDADFEGYYVLEPLSPNLSLAHRKVAELLRCPVDWQEVAPNYSITLALEKYWQEIAASCLPWPGEYFAGLFHPVDFETEAEEDLSRDLPQITAWIERARPIYIDRTRRFRDMKFADEEIYRKHFPANNLSTKQIRAESGRGKFVSKFYRGVTPERLQDVMWTILGDYWRQLLDLPAANIYVDALTVIGASRGHDTSWIHFDVDLSTPQTHAYPILQSEIPKGEARIGIDNLQGYVILD
jgi:hypothetical protein